MIHKNVTKILITQQLWTDLGRSVGQLKLIQYSIPPNQWMILVIVFLEKKYFFTCIHFPDWREQSSSHLNMYKYSVKNIISFLFINFHLNWVTDIWSQETELQLIQI